MERGREGRKERALGERKGENRETQEQSERERVGGEIKRNKSEKGSSRRETETERRGRGKREKRACLTVSQVHSDAWRQTGE